MRPFTGFVSWPLISIAICRSLLQDKRFCYLNWICQKLSNTNHMKAFLDRGDSFVETKLCAIQGTYICESYCTRPANKFATRHIYNTERWKNSTFFGTFFIPKPKHEENLMMVLWRKYLSDIGHRRCSTELNWTMKSLLYWTRWLLQAQISV